MQAVQDEQHIHVAVIAFFTNSLGRHQRAFLLGIIRGNIRLFWDCIASQISSVAHYMHHLCVHARMPGNSHKALQDLFGTYKSC